MDLAAWYLELRSWLIQHPDAILIAIFLVALIEAVAVVGVIVPAVPLLFVLCVLAAHADVSLLSLFMAGIAGAMLGDGISYALGKGFKNRVHTVWPFSHYPRWLQRSEDFVERHGGKSIILGRFIGPLRAFVPMAAGIFRMKPLYFLWMNFLSALVWAPTHLLPGYSLGAAAAHDWLPGRDQLLFIAALLIAAAVLTWLLPWLAERRRRQTAFRPVPNAGRWLAVHGEPADQRAALRLAAVATAGFVAIATLLPWLKPWDAELTRALFDLRQPTLDWLFVALSLLGDKAGLLSFGTVVAGWLLLRRQRDAFLLVLVAAALCLALPDLLKQAFAVPRPAWVVDPPISLSFPSGHAFSAVVTWGLCMVMLERYGNTPAIGMARPFLLTLMLFTIASRPYLGVHWISDVAAGAVLGLASLAGLRWLWYRRPGPSLPLGEMVAMLLTALAVSLVFGILPRFGESLLDYRPLIAVLLP